MEKAISIALVDGHELARYGLRGMLEAEEDMSVVDDYYSIQEALSEMARFHQDIILIGTNIAGMNTTEATRSLKRNRLTSSAEVIILAESMDHQAEALEAGAAAYLPQDTTHMELVHTIRQVYRNSKSLKERGGCVEETVELVIPPSVNTSRLLRFICQLGEMLHDDFGSIISTVGSWNSSTVVTVRTSSATPADLLLQLANMPEVEKVEETPLPRDISPSLTKQFRLRPRLRISPSKRLRITLKETGVAKQELAPISNY
jgi:DNA-binding NarL/FixJ family response regulator